MKNLLPHWARLRPDLTKGQRIIAITLIAFGTLMTVACFIVIFALADLGRPSFLPWIAWFLFGVGPTVTALEEYGVKESEKSDASTEKGAASECSTPPRLHLIRSSEASTDQPYDQEDDHGHHARRAI